MKKLNNKGFTLVELLAVIIILAIVVGISIPAVLTTVNTTRDKAFQTSVETVADWLERQSQAFLVSDDTVVKTDSNYKSACVSGTSIKTSCSVTAELLKAAGVKPSNYNITSASTKITYNSNTGRYCVKLTGSSSGDYSSTSIKSSVTCS